MKNKPQININSELNTNSYELIVKYFQLFGAPIETDAAYAYRNHEPQIKAPRVTPLEGASTYACGHTCLCITAGITPMNADL